MLLSNCGAAYLSMQMYLQVYDGKIKTTDGTKIGRFSYRVVDMNIMRRCRNVYDEFELSERGGNELEALGQGLFNKAGRIDSEFFKRADGSASVFGQGDDVRELTFGKFALLCGEDNDSDPDFRIDDEYCRRGAGTTALKKLFKHKTLRDVTFLFVMPSVNEFPLQLQAGPVEESAWKIIFDFFRSVGFRRVGDSRVLAYALHDEAHPSRHLSIEDDQAVPYIPTPSLASFFAGYNG